MVALPYFTESGKRSGNNPAKQSGNNPAMIRQRFGKREGVTFPLPRRYILVAGWAVIFRFIWPRDQYNRIVSKVQCEAGP